MYCCACGSPTGDDAHYCQKCGKALPPVARLTQNKQEREQSEIARLMSKVNQSHECHGCGRRDTLRGWDFGLGRPLGARTDWDGTLASIALSAVTIPLLGVAGLRLPGKSVTLSVLRLQLLLCDACASQGKTPYSVHPVWSEAVRLGYTYFLDAGALTRLR